MRVVNEKEFADAIASGVVLVDFYADWCGPCKMIAPILKDMAKQYEGKLEIIKVDVDVEGGLAQKYGVMSIPTLILFKDGKPVGQTMG
ncbi:MAG TPA: thioredoxin, partial [Erysipelotrichaceae bacterium]|nr:thioredoxin [Erysipelotrichaceae bacterium]